MITYRIMIKFPVWCIAVALLGQETPTEREAAREVLRKMGELEKSLDVPGWVSKMTAANADRERVVARAKQLMDQDLLAPADDITRHPEIGFEEKRSVEKLTAYLRGHGFEVKVGTPGLETAFVARWKGNRGAPMLGVILEYDARRGRIIGRR
jgi:hypothetical protein